MNEEGIEVSAWPILVLICFIYTFYYTFSNKPNDSKAVKQENGDIQNKNKSMQGKIGRSLNVL